VVSLYEQGAPAAVDYADAGTTATSGSLIVGVRYRITTYNASDDFTNVGAASNATGVEFIATGTTPTTWTASSVLTNLGLVGAWDYSHLTPSSLSAPALPDVGCGSLTWTSGVKPSVPWSGTIVDDLAVGGSLTVGGTSSIAGVRTATATLDFGSIAAAASEDLTITVTGAAANHSVSLGLPTAPAAGIIFQGFVSAADTVTVRATNITGSPVDPGSATYRVTVIGF
jgi:hypothetical protein